ncbi:ribosomal protein L32 [Kwoniella shandongensis]|uniref:Large ribosomal subunit protein bL32m n=1 Tax=Kwoniella shandongensis TaxID=1734106 RepID=A0A5M6C8H4_9TREE|nr:ribosomal protein L32 [Kwoniella shandongensis]KAA5530062.1 ribosomal protein L32 [Kwoniella shandongensis]
MTTLSISSRPLFSLRSFSLFPVSVQRPTWSIPCEASTSSSAPFSPSAVAPLDNFPASLTTTASAWTSLFPSFSLQGLLELIPPIVWASVPKKKTSHSRKSMRAANKGLKNKTNLSLCEACGSIKLTHHVCPTCYSQISRRWKHDARSSLAGEGAPALEQRPAAEP